MEQGVELVFVVFGVADGRGDVFAAGLADESRGEVMEGGEGPEPGGQTDVVEGGNRPSGTTVRDGVAFEPGDRGYDNDRVLTPEYVTELRREFGGVSIYDGLARDMLPAELAGEGEEDLP